MPAKKTATKKTTKKTVTKKTAKKAVKKAAGKVSGKKAAEKPVKKAAKKATKKAAKKTVEAKAGAIPSEEVTRRVTEALKKREPKTSEVDSSKGQPVVFSLADLREFLAKRKTGAPETETPPKKKVAKKKVEKVPAAKKKEEKIPARKKQSFSAVSVADLLGFDPTAEKPEETVSKSTEDGVPKKFLTYYRALVRLHDEVYEGLHRHTEETLRRSNKEDSGDLSSYGQHMADAGTDSFDRDFALSMVSNEQEALYEIDEAIRRIREGNYGVCEITGKAISRDRLKAVPFTRYSVEGQIEVEKGKKRKVQKAGIQGIDGDDSPVISDDDADE